MAAIALTPEQRDLARHALGLPNKVRKSYRNRYTVGILSQAFEAWSALVDAGFAAAHPCVQGQGLVTFHLTYAGAVAALEIGERLDPEDFPLAVWRRGDGSVR